MMEAPEQHYALIPLILENCLPSGPFSVGSFFTELANISKCVGVIFLVRDQNIDLEGVKSLGRSPCVGRSEGLQDGGESPSNL